ncbi:MAG: hypothetical protein JST42_02370 [Bacteroidetes bacterium]|nr:hypothetical protein [Bacteroidota bacterium]
MKSAIRAFGCFYYSLLSCCSAALAMLFPANTAAQDTTDTYLQSHKYPLDIHDFNRGSMDDLFRKKLSGYKIVFLGEGGSHELEFYSDLKYYFLQLLNRSMGVRTYVMEYGSSLATLYNKYLQTGDTSFLPSFRQKHTLDFLKSLQLYNRSEAASNPIRTVGIDFEGPSFYFKGLRSLLSQAPPPAELQTEIGIIQSSPNNLSCQNFSEIDLVLKESLRKKESAYRSYLGQSFEEFHNIITNTGSCRDVLRNRNPNMKRRLELFDSIFKDSLYYAQLGEAHVNFRLRNASWRLNTDRKSPFYQKVAVINVYCYRCDSLNKQVSNWEFTGKMGEGIKERFLKYCDSHFTLFDLTESADPFVDQYAACGQFLLIVRDEN